MSSTILTTSDHRQQPFDAGKRVQHISQCFDEFALRSCCLLDPVPRNLVRTPLRTGYGINGIAAGSLEKVTSPLAQWRADISRSCSGLCLRTRLSLRKISSRKLVSSQQRTRYCKTGCVHIKFRNAAEPVKTRLHVPKCFKSSSGSIGVLASCLFASLSCVPQDCAVGALSPSSWCKCFSRDPSSATENPDLIFRPLGTADT